MTHPHRIAAHLLAVLMLLTAAGNRLASQTGTAAGNQGTLREYTLQATILGYKGVGGEIDGVRNPTLWAVTGDTVRITIVNGELMVHDVALEAHSVKSAQILDLGATTSVTFTAKASDTYFCSVPGHRAAGMEGRFEVSDEPPVQSEGVPAIEDGNPVNLDFETGTLDDWVATGTVFQVIEGDPVDAKGVTTRNGHAGSFWVTSNADGGPGKGTLTSAPFTVAQPFASFLVSGGAFASTRVELLLADGDEVIYTISGADQIRLRPAVVDLTAHVGKVIKIRLVDDETGETAASYIRRSAWAHISFDQFRFHETRPFFAAEIVPSEILTLPAMDTVAHAGLSADDAARAMTLPPGFTATLAASEPDVVRPIAFADDDRGRLWVAEAHTYPVRAEEGEGHDRILIMEDTDGDGRLDSRKVFAEDLNLVSGIEVGFGGVFVGAAPYLMFIPIDESGDRPAGPPHILLDGWGYDDTHEMLNTFTWGPDGWLYGTHGVFTQSKVGKPGTPESERQPLNGGIWRYHPTKKVFEVFSEGYSNPWGLDFNDYGHAFTTACVIEHLFHAVQGARYKRQAGKHFNPYIYEDIETIADHVHWVGKRGPHAGNNRSSSAGGGHAHAGAMIYLGGDTWPAEYRDAIFMNNIHGHRANMDVLKREGSGYTAAHGKDFLFANDAWSQMLNFRYGPDGSVHVIDWYDKNQCHSSNPEIHQKTLGRIFKIRHEKDQWVQVDLQKRTSLELVEMQLHRNDWYVRHARRILQERGPDREVHAALMKILEQNPDVTRKLRALWALHVTGGLSEDLARRLLAHENEYVRSWAVYLLVEDRQASPKAIDQFGKMAAQDRSPLVRLYLASALQRIPAERRWDAVAALLARQEDAGDHNLPLMVWYAAEPLAAIDAPRALGLALDAKLPHIFSFTVQRIAALKTQDALRVLADRLAKTTDRDQQRDLVTALGEMVKQP
jgi:putative membrane-bound dehydrogenase-like protein